MSRLLVAAAIVGATLCGCGREELPFPELGSEREIVSRSRALARDTAFTAVGLRPEAKRDDGATSWDRAFRDWKERADQDSVRRNFELKITNRDRSAREFSARIEYRDADGKLFRTRILQTIVVPPLTEKTLYGFTRIRSPGDADVLCIVEEKDFPATN